jgi:hypothetical protein
MQAIGKIFLIKDPFGVFAKKWAKAVLGIGV